MKTGLITCLMFASGLLTIAGCSQTQSSVYKNEIVTENGEPGYITVQHCLIAFQGTVDSAIRSQEEAEQLANELFEKAQAGEDFDQIVRDHTDDSPPGIYRMSNFGQMGDTTPRIPGNKVYPRGEMVPAFGDVGFKLDVGEYGLAPFDPQSSKYGYHIIKRID